MSKQVGYLTNYPGGLEGERGTFYDYILAGNGLFIEASKPTLSVRIPVADCPIRGLAPIKEKIALTYGSIPQHFFDLALDAFLAAPDKESYVAVTADAGYHFHVPTQEKKEGSVTYELGDSVILDIHSHANMGAFFSGTDDKDETGLKLYAVIGKLREEPMVQLRVGCYGYFYPVLWKEVFDGTLYGAKEFEEEHIQSAPVETEIHAGSDSSRSLWWKKWFR